MQKVMGNFRRVAQNQQADIWPEITNVVAPCLISCSTAGPTPPPPVYLDERGMQTCAKCCMARTVTDGVGDPGSPDQPYAQYTFNNFSDGKTFEFRPQLRQPDGKPTTATSRLQSRSAARREIKAIVLDNELGRCAQREGNQLATS